MSGRAGRIIAVVVTAAVLAVSTSAAVADVAKAPGWKQALWIRSDALNRAHHLGDYRRGAGSAAEPSWKRALRIRGEVMNRS
jgi:hypothetical protein